MRDEFGLLTSQKIKNRIDDILAAEHVSELPIPGNITGDSAYEISFSSDGYILLNANHLNNPKDSKGNIDWSKVRRVKIVSIGGNVYDNQ
ncbi:hypothetical protein [uncultured Gilvimarinus sp.]|uniref:hypothetical protein n=1 Tax=uncultured Gilvimarinus sp. TaxID=1689143 RepID=UPI0030D9197F